MSAKQKSEKLISVGGKGGWGGPTKKNPKINKRGGLSSGTGEQVIIRSRRSNKITLF